MIGSTATWCGADGDWRTSPYGCVFVDSIWDVPYGVDGFLVNAGSNIPTLSRGMLVGRSLMPLVKNSQIQKVFAIIVISVAFYLTSTVIIT